MPVFSDPNFSPAGIVLSAFALEKIILRGDSQVQYFFCEFPGSYKPCLIYFDTCGVSTGADVTIYYAVKASVTPRLLSDPKALNIMDKNPEKYARGYVKYGICFDSIGPSVRINSIHEYTTQRAKREITNFYAPLMLPLKADFYKLFPWLERPDFSKKKVAKNDN
jgi:hypothetical protein